MNNERIYQDWKEHRSQIEIGEGFVDIAMNRIHRYEQSLRKPLFDVIGFVEFISARPLAKVGFIVAGGVIGFIRVAFMIQVFLFT